MPDDWRDREVLTLDEFKERMECGENAIIQVTSVDGLKTASMIALQAQIKKYLTQFDVGIAWGIPQSTVSDIATGKESRFRAEYLLDLLFKSGSKVKLSVGIPF